MRRLLVIALLVASGGAVAVGQVPLPRPRPPGPVGAPAALQPGRHAAETATPAPVRTGCQLRLAEVAQFQPLPAINGPGACGSQDLVQLEAVLLPDKARVTVNPPARLNCRMAVAVARWTRNAVVPATAKLGTLRHIVNYDSYSCRGRNRVAGARISEHGKGNAFDVRAFKLADGRVIAPTDIHMEKGWRKALKTASCARFTTVLGPGSDGYHESHVHLDLAVRRGAYRLCRWEVREPTEIVAAVPAFVPLPRPRPVALRR